MVRPRPAWNLAIATGTPGPDVLDVDQHGPAGNGYPALRRACVGPDWSTAPPRTYGPRPAECTPTSLARTSTMAACPATTWTSAPPAATSSPRPPRSTASPTSLISRPGGHGTLDWAAVTTLLEPQRQHERPAPGHAADRRLDQLARWVARQSEGNRNAGLYWAANRALDANPAADLSPLAAAARQAGLGEPEITRTLDSARRTRQPDRQAEEIN